MISIPVENKPWLRYGVAKCCAKENRFVARKNFDFNWIHGQQRLRKILPKKGISIAIQLPFFKHMNRK